jgi:hypothetical protein
MTPFIRKVALAASLPLALVLLLASAGACLADNGTPPAQKSRSKKPARGTPGTRGTRATLDPLHYRDQVWSAVEGLRRRDIVKMFSAIAGGSHMGPGDGWFGPGQGRYDWKWLARRYDADGDGRITRKEFTGPAALFDRLDRNGDDVLTADDFDWSEKSPYVRMSSMIDGWSRRMDSNGNGRVSREEWDEFFKKAARGKDHLNPEDLREALLKMPPRKPQKPDKPGAPDAKPEKGPTPEVLFAGLFKGDLGSPFEGPAVGARAPSFSLQTPDGKRRIALAESRGKKPVVLVFGSFT